MIKSDAIYHYLETEELLTLSFPPKSQGNLTIILSKSQNIKIIAGNHACWSINFDFKYNKKIKIESTVILKTGAKINHNLANLTSKGNIFFAQQVNINKFAEYTGTLLDLSSGSAEISNEINLKENSKSYFRCAVISKKDDTKTITIKAKNNQSLSSSVMDNYGVVKENGILTFEGIGKIKKGSKNSQNRQNSKIIVFDDKSQANIKPLLLIDEYDVMASHSAAVGKINEEHLYYLCSRGLIISEARRFITLGYLTPVLDYIQNQEIVKKASIILKRSVA